MDTDRKDSPLKTEAPLDDKAQKTRPLFTEESEGHENLENIEGGEEAKSSGGVLISITINILLIASFLMEFKIEDASKMNFAIQSEFDSYPISTNPPMFLADLSKMEEIVFFMREVFLGHVLNPNQTYTPLKYETMINTDVNLSWYLSASSTTPTNPGEIVDSISEASPGISFEPEAAEPDENADFDMNNQLNSSDISKTIKELKSMMIDKSKIRVKRSSDRKAPLKASPSERKLQDDIFDDEEEEEDSGYTEPQDEDYSNPNYSSESSYYFLNSFNLFKGMLIRVEYDDSYDLSELELPNEVFISATMSAEEAYWNLYLLEVLLDLGLLVSYQTHTIFFNVITQVGLYHELDLSQTSTSSFTAIKRVKPFFPKVFDSDYEDQNAKVMILIFRCLFGLTLLFRIIKVIIIDLYKAIKTFFQTKKLDLPMSLVFNIIIIGLLVLVLVLSVFHSVRQAGTFDTFAVIDIDQFEKFMGFADFLYIFLRFLAVIIALLVVQILLLLNTQFPTFGVLFYTLNSSKNKLLLFAVLIITLMAGFVCFMTINFGPYDEEMSGFGSALLLVFEYMIGVVDIEKLKVANETIAYVFFFLFFMIFNLWTIIIFIVIIIGTYVHLRKKLQLTTLALAELAAEKSNKLKEKYINLILFKPADEGNADIEQPRDASGKKPIGGGQKKKRNLMEILLYNLEEVDWFGLTNTTRQTRDQIEEEIKNKIIEIKIRKENQKKKKMEDRRKGLFDKIANMAIYLAFIVIYTYTMTYQIKVEKAFDLNQTLENYYIKSVFVSESGLNKTFYDISTIEDVVLWTKRAYLGRIFSGFLKDSQTATSILQPYSQNAISSAAVSRITIRNLKTQVKSDGEYNFTVRVPVDIDDTDPYTTSETIQDITSPDGVLNQLYTFSGTYETFRKKGGYVWAFTRDLGAARNATAQIQHPRVINLNTALVAYQTVYMSRNYQTLGLSEFVLKIRSTGEVTKYYKTKSFQIDLYHCDECAAELAFGIVYLLIILKQTYDIVKKWKAQWDLTSNLTPIKEEYKNREFFVRLLNYDMNNFKFLPFMLALVIRIWQITNRIIRTTLNLFQIDYANLILVLSLVLTYVSVYFYFSFMFNSFRQNYNINAAFSSLTDGVSFIEEIGRHEELARLMENYTLIQAFNSWLIILRILFTYGFSKELSLVLELIYEALFDIVFFIAMFVIILIGFSIDGYLIFGAQTDTFSDITGSFLQVLLMMITGDSPDDLVNVDNLTRAFYYIFLIVLCLLILLKMFLAILDGQFTEMTSDKNFNDNLGVIELIISVVVEKVKEAKFDEDYETVPEGAGRFTKLRIASINKLKAYRLKILNTLRRIIFGPEDHIQIESPDTAAVPGEKKKIEIELKFNEKAEERKQDLEEIKVYLEEDKLITSPQMEEQEIEVAKDELDIPSKWMGTLEDAVTRISNKHVKFAKYGTGARDYLKIETETNQDLFLKLNDMEIKCNADRPQSMPLVDYYTDYVAIPDFKKLSKKFKGQVYYEKTMEHLKFIFYKSLKKTDEDGEENPDESLIEDDDDDMASPAHKLHKNARDTRKQTFVRTPGAYRESSFSDPNENLLKFWNCLKFSHKFELWAGDRADLMSNDLRHCLWTQMKFEGATFGHFIPKDLFHSEDLKVDKIGMSELECIWDYLKVTNNIKNKDKPLLGQGASGKGLNTEHTDLIEHIVRNDLDNIIFELRKFETLKEKMRFLETLKTVKHDQKLMLWLLMTPQAKLELSLRIKNPVLADFTMLLLMEEVYDNVYLLEKLEKGLDVEMQNRVYMHFLYFANFEASQHSMSNHRQDYLPDDDPDLLDYIHFLESQLDTTTKAKVKCLDQVQKILKVEEAKRSELELSKNDDSYLKNMAKFATGATNEDEKSLLLRHEVSNKSTPALNKENASLLLKEDNKTDRKLEKDDSKIEDEADLRNDFKNFKNKDPTKF